MGIVCVIACLAGAANHFFNQPKPPVAPPPPVAVKVEPVAVKVEPVAPGLKRIAIKHRSDINNATIRELNRNGILFQCDEGLVQAQLTDLPEDFQNYYGKAIKDAAAASNTSRQNSIVRQSYQFIFSNSANPFFYFNRKKHNESYAHTK